MIAALHPWIGKICHIYLDDIVVWLQMLEDHERNVHTILKALCDTCLYINPEKTHLFCMEIDFLGHHISTKGIEADKNKVDHILNWPEPKNATEAHGFLGLVCYLANFLPSLAEHTGVLTNIT